MPSYDYDSCDDRARDYWYERMEMEREEMEMMKEEKKEKKREQLWRSECRTISDFLDKISDSETSQEGRINHCITFLLYLQTIPAFMSTQIVFRSCLINKLDIWISHGLPLDEAEQTRDFLEEIKRRDDYVE